jgi:hypothetical protein
VVNDPDDLFALLLEQAVPSTPDTWFEPPWKEGRNAIWLGRDLIEVFFEEQELPPTVEGILQFIVDSTLTIDTVDAYWTAQELKQVASESSHHATTLVDVLDMIQKWTSRSDGGGWGYNGILKRICERFISNGGNIETIEPIVRRWRARDAIGLIEQGEPADQTLQRRLRAFESAWVRGLYKVAYCI